MKFTVDLCICETQPQKGRRNHFIRINHHFYCQSTATNIISFSYWGNTTSTWVEKWARKIQERGRVWVRNPLRNHYVTQTQRHSYKNTVRGQNNKLFNWWWNSDYYVMVDTFSSYTHGKKHRAIVYTFRRSFQKETEDVNDQGSKNLPGRQGMATKKEIKRAA